MEDSGAVLPLSGTAGTQGLLCTTLSHALSPTVSSRWVGRTGTSVPTQMPFTKRTGHLNSALVEGTELTMHLRVKRAGWGQPSYSASVRAFAGELKRT